jgi:broad specificity phosphatase PhoE
LATRIVLVRHGETDWNRANRFQGHADPSLNETGRAQARALASELRDLPFAAAYTSPLRRAAETAALLGAELGLERLEYGHGWDDGETYDELGARVVAGLVGIAARHAGGQVLAVTHGGPIRSALASAEGVSFGEARRSIHVIGNCAVVRLAARDGKLERVD